MGTKEYVKRILKVKGTPQKVIDEIADKIEVIIALSGKLGRELQREKDLKELKELHLELCKLKREGR